MSLEYEAKAKPRTEGLAKEENWAMGVMAERARPGRVTEENVHDAMHYHKPELDQIPHFESVSLAAENLARVILASAPSCADRSEALRCVRAAMLWANSAIALRGEI